jgi:hypothetical protein
MFRRFWLAGAAALMFVLGTLFLAGPAQAACEDFQPGTQSWASCTLADREGAPAGPSQEGPTTRVVEVSSTEVWQLAVAGLIGAGIAVGATVAVSRLAQRQSAPAQ